MKRACDRCIERKVKCDGCRPCQRCVAVQPQTSCTYLKQARKRGPKPSRKLAARFSISEPKRKISTGTEIYPRQSPKDDTLVDPLPSPQVVASPASYLISAAPAQLGGTIARFTPKCVSQPLSASGSTYICSHTVPQNTESTLQTLHKVIEEYRSKMYPVWPVIHVDRLLEQLHGPEVNADVYVLATALCAATMAQLHLDSIGDHIFVLTSKDMESECTRTRAECDYREKPNLEQVLASFFLHVYHAKINRQKAALVYVQESLSLARLLHLNDGTPHYGTDESDCSVNSHILYLLLWVSERGYAVQYALPISSKDKPVLPNAGLYKDNIYILGLINLTILFITFENSQVPEFSRYGTFPLTCECLLEIEDNLVDVAAPSTRFNIVQKIDFTVTKQWMRILLWQQAMSRGLLSSFACHQSMRILFPAEVAQDLLASTTLSSIGNLIPLGRDQLVKLFEITNSLADAILCRPPTALMGHRVLGPSDVLHALYQSILPLLKLDPVLYSTLREKTASVLLRTPSRMFMFGPAAEIEPDERISIGPHI